MKAWLVEFLTCPFCENEPDLEVSIDWALDDEIIDGHLTCPCCGKSWAIRDGVPRFVQPSADYCGNFGFQWRHWKDIQIDRLAGHTLSRDRFLADSEWDPQWLNGKLILDCGCGAGRFADVAASLGARVIAVDLSEAVEACYQTTAHWQGAVQPIQASLFQLPLKRAVFDGLYCMGVIQHTPDPEAVMQALPKTLRPGGRLVYNFYEADFWPKLQPFKYALRLVTRHLPTAPVLTLSRILTATLFPLSRVLARIPKVRILNHVLPICASHSPALTEEQQYTWTLLDTFDWYSPRYERRQKHSRVATLLNELGLAEVRTRPGIAQAHMPEVR